MTIKVLIVEDSPIVTTILKRLLDSSPEIIVVGTARTGVDGLEMIPKVQPDVVCTDLYMPQMNGLEFTREVMSRFPRPILVISAAVQDEDKENVFSLLEAGAVDIFPKPRAGSATDYDLIKEKLITKIRILSGVRVFTQNRSHAATKGTKTPLATTNVKSQPKSAVITSFPTPATIKTTTGKGQKIVAIGASTGGPQALQKIFSSLPVNFPTPVLCVQHISEGFLQGLLDWLGTTCHLQITIAQAGESPKPGKIYFPPEQKHLELDSYGRFYISNAPPMSGHRPSVTTTFNSVAQFYGRDTLGVLLTGMGRDGADGMLKIAQLGGHTIAQSESSCVVFGMPHEAIILGAAKEILPVEAIASAILKRVGVFFS